VRKVWHVDTLVWLAELCHVVCVHVCMTDRTAQLELLAMTCRSLYIMMTLLIAMYLLLHLLYVVNIFLQHFGSLHFRSHHDLLILLQHCHLFYCYSLWKITTTDSWIRQFCSLSDSPHSARSELSEANIERAKIGGWCICEAQKESAEPDVSVVVSWKGPIEANGKAQRAGLIVFLW